MIEFCTYLRNHLVSTRHCIVILYVNSLFTLFCTCLHEKYAICMFSNKPTLLTRRIYLNNFSKYIKFTTLLYRIWGLPSIFLIPSSDPELVPMRLVKWYTFQTKKEFIKLFLASPSNQVTTKRKRKQNIQSTWEPPAYLCWLKGVK